MIDRFVLNVIYDRFNTAVFPMSLCLLRTHWTDRICLALPKISTKFVSAKSVSAHWDTAYLLITRVNHMRQEPPSQRSKNFRIYQT